MSSSAALSTLETSPVEINNDTHAVVAAPVLPAHIDRVDGLRGLAALLIVVYHLFTGCNNPEWRPFRGFNALRLLHDGWSGVNLFLVLSGFCLYWPYARNPQRRLVFAEFMRRRAWRLLPPYYASLLLVPLVYILLIRLIPEQGMEAPLPHNALDVVLHLLLLQSLYWKSFHSWCGITWSLSLEWTWYLAFLAAVWLFHRLGALRALVVLSIVTMVYRIGLYIAAGPATQYSADKQDWVWALRAFLPGRLCEFGLGMYVAWWLANRMISRNAVRTATIVAPLLLLLAHMATPVDVFLPVRDCLYGAAFALLLLVVVAPQQNAIQRLAGSKWISNIGCYSYSLYLFHLPFVAAICALLAQCRLHGFVQFAAALLCLPLILGSCKLIFLAVEKPFLRTTGKPVAQANITDTHPISVL